MELIHLCSLNPNTLISNPMKKTLLSTFISISLLFLPRVNFGQAPNLATSTSFTIFTGAGAITGTGTSVIKGNLGTDAGAITGITPVEVNGNIFTETSPVSAQAAIDVCAAYNDLASRTCGTTIGVTLGNNQTLTPGVYCTGAASTLTGNLTLNGGGDPNSIFIIKINGAFATAALSIMTLMNGASMSNVFFQVNGQVDLGQNSVFRGTILSNGAINLLDGADLLGRALACNGAISLSNNTADNRAAAAPLPVTLTSFTVQNNSCVANLKWTTASEQNSKHFEVQHSTDGEKFSNIGNVASSGNSNVEKRYSFSIKLNDANNYFRLNMVDLDGSSKFSLVARVTSNCNNRIISVFPNPSKNIITVNGLNENDQVNLLDQLGRVIKSIKTNNVSETLDLSGISPGIYMIQVLKEDILIKNIKVVKQ